MPSEDSKGLLPKLGIEDSFHRMLLVRYERCGVDYLPLMKNWECDRECEGLKGYYDGHNQNLTVAHTKIPVAKRDERYKMSWETITVR